MKTTAEHFISEWLTKPGDTCIHVHVCIACSCLFLFFCFFLIFKCPLEVSEKKSPIEKVTVPMCTNKKGPFPGTEFEGQRTEVTPL